MSSPSPHDAMYRYRFGDVELDETRMQLQVAGQGVELEPRPLALLLELLRHAGEIVTREELIESVWAGRPTVDNVIPNAITKLRRALGPGNADTIVNVPRVGYRLDAAVERTVLHAAIAGAAALDAGQAVPGRPGFRLQAQLGRGGSHEVWLAREAASGDVRVFKFSVDGRSLPALKREAALSRLLRATLGERADIAAVLDWNFSEAPFFLEFAYGGDDLAHWAEADGRLAPMPRDARLALFLQIADAVAAAHGVGVLHKDIKPANALVDARADGGWQVRLTDFGSGGLLDPARLAELGITRPGLLATADLSVDGSSGTPAYYAPELLAGQSPSVCSDLYALGVLAWQLLVGDFSRPLSPGWERALGDELLAEDIAQATDLDPQRRFASVDEFAQRLRALEPRRAQRLRQQEIERHALDAARLRARVRARRPWVVATVAVLALGLGAFAWQFREASTARDDARREARQAEAINAFLVDDLLRAGNPSLWGKRDPSMREVLDRARKRLDQRDDLASDDAAGIHATLAQAYQASSDYPAAEAQYLKAIERGHGGTLALQAELQLARLLAVRSKLPESEGHLQHALAAAGPLERRRDHIPMYAHWAQASALTLSQRLDEAAASYRQALDAESRFSAPIASTRSLLLLELADTLSRGGRMGQTIEVLRELLDPAKTPGANAANRANAHLLLGRALVAERRLDEAEQALEHALAGLIEIYGTESYYVYLAHSELAPLHWLSGRHESALRHARTSHEGFTRLFGDDHPVPLLARQVLATAEFFAGNLDAAVAHHAAAHAGLADKLGATAPQTMGAAYYLAFALAEQTRLDEAERLVPGIDPVVLGEATREAAWPWRLQALRGLVQAGRNPATGTSPELAEAITRLEAEHEPERYLTTLRSVATCGNGCGID